MWCESPGLDWIENSLVLNNSSYNAIQYIMVHRVEKQAKVTLYVPLGTLKGAPDDA